MSANRQHTGQQASVEDKSDLDIGPDGKRRIVSYPHREGTCNEIVHRFGPEIYFVENGHKPIPAGCLEGQAGDDCKSLIKAEHGSRAKQDIACFAGCIFSRRILENDGRS